MKKRWLILIVLILATLNYAIETQETENQNARIAALESQVNGLNTRIIELQEINQTYNTLNWEYQESKADRFLLWSLFVISLVVIAILALPKKEHEHKHEIPQQFQYQKAYLPRLILMFEDAKKKRKNLDELQHELVDLGWHQDIVERARKIAA